MLPPVMYWAILLSVVVYAFRRGALDERIAAMTCLVGTLATVALGSMGASEFHKFNDVEITVLVVDLFGFAIFTAIALKSARFWPLWVAGFQLSSMMAHFLRAFNADMLPQVYAAAERFWIYPIFLAIAVGIWRAQRDDRSMPHGFAG